MKGVRPTKYFLELEKKGSKRCKNANEVRQQPTPAKVEKKVKNEYSSNECFKHGWIHRWCACGNAAWRFQRPVWRQRLKVQKIDPHHT